MKTRMPPIPPANRSRKDPPPEPDAADANPSREDSDNKRQEENVRQNTHNQGYQQDR